MRVWFLRGAALVALASLITEFGFPLTTAWENLLHAIDLAVAAVLVTDVLARLWHAPDRRAHLRRHGLELLVLALVASEIAAALASGAPLAFTGLYIVGVQTYLVARLALAAVRANERIAAASFRPAWVLVGSFVVLIAFGTLLLMLPNCRAAGVRPWSFLDALFTATSAGCVTGLAVRDTGTELSFRGQAVVLVLIQIGGLGLVTFAMFFTYVFSRTLRVRQMTMVRDLLSVEVMGNLGRFLVHALLVTFFAEALGAAVLFHHCDVPGLSPGSRLWWGVFHSISAFCNAGFGLAADGFMRYCGNLPVSLMLCALVVAGGIGFPVIDDLLHVRVGDLPWFRRRRRGQDLSARPVSKLTLNTKVVLAATGILLLVGSVLFYVSERNRLLADRPFAEAATASFFQAVMPRTAGFNSVDTAAYAEPTLLLTIVLMVIGAAPVSTGGGVKVTSFLVLALTLRAILRNREPIDAFGRSIPRRALNAAVSVCILYAVAFLLMVTLLMITQSSMPFLRVAFESVSALSTVGLSVGVTASLDGFGRLVFCAAMLFGRVGPLAIAVSVISQPDPLRYQYPEESVVVS